MLHRRSIHSDDILKNVDNQPYGCWSGIRKINIQAYADDIVVFCPTASELRRSIKLIVNVTKTKVVIFGKNKKP